MRHRYVNIRHWCSISKRGEEVEYHRGFLMSDRKSDADLSQCADIALRCFETGHVVLFQRKIRPADLYSYIARRTGRK